MSATEGPEIWVRCKVAARGTSDWHGLILGGRALDCEAKRGLGFRPGPDCHILDSLGIQVPRCEDNTNARQDRAYILLFQFCQVLTDLALVSQGAAIVSCCVMTRWSLRS